MVTASIHIKDDTNVMMKAFAELERTHVLVGIPESNAGRDGEITNAALLYIHSNGSPLNNLPARPVIEPALERNMDKIGEILSAAITNAADGDISGMNANLEKAGLAGQTAAINYMNDKTNGMPPLAPSTVKRKQRKGSGIAPDTGASDSQFDNPLIDTGSLRNSITYVIRQS